MNHNPQLIDLYDELNRTLEDLAPTLENLAHQPGGDRVAEYDIMELFHKATRALWDYMYLRERRTATVRPEPEPPGMDKLERDPHFPMKQFKRLLVRFVKAAFDDDDLNEHPASIDVHISDGDGGGLHREVVYWHNNEGGADAAGCVTTSQPAESDQPAPRDDHQPQAGAGDDVQLTPRLRHLLRLAQKLARQKREYDAAGVDGDGMFEPDLLGKAITNVTNRIAECLEYGDDQDDDAGDDHSQDDPPAADTDFGLDIDLSDVKPTPTE